MNNIPSRTTEQKEVYRKQKQKNRSEKYRDEDVPQILYNEFDSLYGEQGNILEDHDICLTMAVIAYYFKQYREHMSEQHTMISAKYANQFMGVMIGDDSPLLKADVEEKDELRFYQDMIDERAAKLPRWVKEPLMAQTTVSAPKARAWERRRACPLWRGSNSQTIPMTMMCSFRFLLFYRESGENAT